MAFFNKLFTKDLEPYELKGRYYKLMIDSSMNVTGDKDIFSSCYVYNNQYLYLQPKHGFITDVVSCCTSSSTTHAVNNGHIPAVIASTGMYRSQLATNNTALVDGTVYVQVVDL